MKYMSITISGAVSLGAYEAGVLYEVIRAIGQHNKSAASDDDKIVVDALAGASAGGMTAVIVAQRLLYSAGELDGASTNVLYRTWVEGVDLEGLLTMQSEDNPDQSLLSTQLVEQISIEKLVARYHVKPKPAGKVHPAIKDKIAVGLALSNLNGVDFSKPTETGTPFTYTRFQDELVEIIRVDDAAKDTYPVWSKLREGAVACGAFPGAFRLKALDREAKEYEALGADIMTLRFPQFAYTDGGVFHNEPLGLAKTLVDLVDEHHQSHGRRHYVFVAPSSRESAVAADFRADKAKIPEAAVRLAKAVFNQARFKDWVRVEKVNEKLGLFEAQAEALRGTVTDATTDLTAFEKTFRTLLNLAYAEKAEQEKALERLRRQYRGELDGLPDDATRDAWMLAVAVLEKTAGVENYDPMRVYQLVSSPVELAGGCLFGFGGFFDQKYRHHDYEVGRKTARDWIESLNTRLAEDLAANPGMDVSGRLAPIRCDLTKEVPVVDDTLCNVQPRDLSEDKRKRFRDQIIKRANNIMADHGIGGIVRGPIDVLWLKPKLDKWLGLD